MGGCAVAAMLHVMADTDPAPTSALSSGTTRTHRAEDDIGRSGDRALAWLVTPFLAAIPWLLTMGGLWVLGRAARTQAVRFETAWVEVLGAAALLVVAALLWAAVTAWSSVGTTLAGVVTLVLGVLLHQPSVAREAYRLLSGGASGEVWYVVTPMNFLLLGSLLVAGGLGAAGARRMGR